MTTQSELLSAIADDFTERLRNADEPSIDEYVRKHPELAEDIRKLFPSIQVMEQLSTREHQDRSFERRTRKLTIEPDGLLGDFKIIREIGRGGMGVVYEAEQRSLKRRVALKILGPTMANSPKQLARFQSEAKAAARLHHTNIVSVYGVGEHDGLYYYAMQLIDGMTLGDAIALNETGGDFVTLGDPPTVAESSADMKLAAITRTFAGDSSQVHDPSGEITVTRDSGSDSGSDVPGEPRHLNDINRSLHDSSRWLEIARLGACVADALHYAHRNGVLHRDIKPSNLMIDRQGVVWITDFGLAHHEDRDAVTATGDIVGTLRYMAPEQFSGQFDGRCDTYSLGMTIYEMLTLRPAFTEARHGPLINQKTTSKPPRPRSLNPDIPRDLETIVLKACEIDPAGRYQTPGELAADLRRFCEDRPIHARRVSFRERVWRWSRRNPLAAGLGLISMLLLASVFMVFAVLNVRLSGAVKRAQEEQREAGFARTLATSRLKITRDVTDQLRKTINTIMQGVAARSLPEPLQFELDSDGPVSLGVLTSSDIDNLKVQLASSLQFANDFGEKAEVEESAAGELVTAGEIQRQLGQYDEAVLTWLDALERFRQLLKLNRTSLLYVTEQCRLHALIDLTRPMLSSPSVVPQEVGIETAVELLTEYPNMLNTTEGMLEYVRTLHAKHLVALAQRDRRRLVGSVAAGGSWAGEIEDNRLATEVLRRLMTQDPANSEYQLLSIRLQTDRGRLALLEGNPSDAGLYLGSATRLLQERILQDAENTALKCELGYVLCLSPELPTGLNTAIARESLQVLSGKLDELTAANRGATHAATISNVAQRRLEQLGN